MAKQKAKQAATKATVVATKRSGYKRKTNKRIDVLGAQLESQKKKALREAAYTKALTFAQPVKKAA